MDLKSFLFQKVALPLAIRLDKFKGLDFLTVVRPEQVGLNPTLSFGYSPSSKRFLKQVLNDFTIWPQDSIMDIGCGKGYAMRTMLKYRFKKVDGIELSAYIANTARENLRKLNSIRSKIFIGDAAQFNGYDAYNFIYFFNPFPDVVMAEVMNSLSQSLERNDRELILIYMNPICDEAIISNNNFKKTGIYRRKGNWITIYSNRNYENSKVKTNKRMYQITEDSALLNELRIYLEKHPLYQKHPYPLKTIN